MEIVGLSGYARSGKDEAAKVLVEEFGFTRVAFADKLRDFLYALNPLVTIKRTDAHLQVKTPQGTKRLMWDADTPSTVPISMPVYVQDVIDNYGWDKYKESEYGAEVRRLLQRLGTEAGRQTMWDSIWIDAAFADVPKDAKVVVTDCRFPNEADSIISRGGKVWRVRREGVGPANAHPSETSLDDWPFDVVLYNDGSLEDYHREIRSTYNACRI